MLYSLAAQAVEPIPNSFGAAACLNEKATYPKYKEREANQFCTDECVAQYY
jgi:hypothetical protein